MSFNEDSIDTFLSNWFKVGEHQFGQYRYTECKNLGDIKTYIEECRANKEPAFSSVSPHGIIHKLFWEFDTEEFETDNYSYAMPELDSMWEQACRLAMNIIDCGGKPLIVYSGKRGFHVWANIQAIKFAGSNETMGKKFYKELIFSIIKDPDEYKNWDRHPTSVNSMARIPFSYHQKTGNRVLPLTIKRTPYVPDVIDFYRHYIDSDYVQSKFNALTMRMSESSKRINEMPKPESGDWKIRGCIIDALKKNPTHNARLAYLLDALYAGYSDENIHNEMKVFGKNDYDVEKTQYQIDFARESIKAGMKPVSNETLKRWGILRDTIGIWNKTKIE